MADAAAMPGAGTPYSPASLRLGRDGGKPAGIVNEGGHHSARQRFTQQAATPAAAGLVPQGRLKPRGRLLAGLRAAGREAAADGSAEIGTHHLLVGLFEEGVGAAILERLGVRADAVRAAARELFPGTGQPGEVPPAESGEARDAIGGAEALARRGGCGYVGTEHLLGALALDPGPGPPGPGPTRCQHPAVKRELECGGGKQQWPAYVGGEDQVDGFMRQIMAGAEAADCRVVDEHIE